VNSGVRRTDRISLLQLVFTVSSCDYSWWSVSVHGSGINLALHAHPAVPFWYWPLAFLIFTSNRTRAILL